MDRCQMLMCSSQSLYIQAEKTFTLLQKASSEVGVCQKKLLQCMFEEQSSKAKALKHVSK